jgi:tRNA-2-methylthio-N6-dimethylallyladenosine synthase
MEDIKFINSYSYIFSARPGTPAFNLEKINLLDAKKRLMNFQEVANKIKVDYRKNLINENVNVLFENKTKKEKKYFGRDEHFNSVIVENNEDLVGKIKSIKILNVNHNTLFGEVISDMSKKNYAA